MSRIFAAYSIGGLIGPALGAVGGIAGPFTLYLALVLIAIPLVLRIDHPTIRTFSSDRSALSAPGVSGWRPPPSCSPIWRSG